jgi:xyloglucan:xyloglucosyl transferase
VYGSIWDASDWVTDDGGHRADYRYQPFVAHLDRFVIVGCADNAPARCSPVPASPAGAGLTPRQYETMRWAQREHMVYYYCNDFRRDHSLTPKC